MCGPVVLAGGASSAGRTRSAANHNFGLRTFCTAGPSKTSKGRPFGPGRTCPTDTRGASSTCIANVPLDPTRIANVPPDPTCIANVPLPHHTPHTPLPPHLLVFLKGEFSRASLNFFHIYTTQLPNHRNKYEDLPRTVNSAGVFGLHTPAFTHANAEPPGTDDTQTPVDQSTPHVQAASAVLALATT